MGEDVRAKIGDCACNIQVKFQALICSGNRQGDPCPPDTLSLRPWKTGLRGHSTGRCWNWILCGEGWSLLLPARKLSQRQADNGAHLYQTPPAARKFYTSKVEELGKNLQDLEVIVQQKNGNLRVVEDGELQLRD